ncbi:MAG: DUF3488 domain-containing protein [Candidatus Wallbacteria bacterium]|nr:DUF3488 domain-containing protein [Candidatus Wallbacteria bacterium]
MIRVPSDVDSAYRLAVFAMVGSGFLAMLVTDQFPLSFWLLVPISMACSLGVRAGWFHPPRALALLAGALMAGLIAADLLVLSSAVSNMRYAGRVVLYLQLIALFLPEREWGFRLMSALGFAHLVASAALTTNMAYLAASIGFIVAGTWVLVLQQVRQGIRRTGIHGENQWRSMVAGAMVGRMTTVALVVFALTVGLFFGIPRYGAGYFFSRGEEAPVVSGFSEEVRLGSLGELKNSDEIVMRVILKGLEPPLTRGLYWRGVALDIYDGTGWRRGRGMVRRLTSDDQGFQDRNYDLSVGQELQPCQVEVIQQFFLNHPNTAVIFAAPRPIAVTGKFSKLTIDDNTSVRVEFPAFSSFYYVVRSAMQCATRQELRESAIRYSSRVASQGLQLPPGIEKIRELARLVTRDKTNPYDQAVAIESFLATGFNYTLELGDVDAKRPLEDFLFRKKAGHCEFFATAMAVMLRTIGVPARIVNGYQQGEWNDVGKYFVVRRREAHSWVEVYFHKYGWIEFDPTPQAGRSSYQGTSFLSALLMMYDTIRLYWKRSVIEYHLLDQVEHLRRIAGAMREARRALYLAYDGLRQQMKDVATGRASVVVLLRDGTWLALLVVVLMPGLLLARRAGLGWGRVPPLESRIRFFTRMLELLRDRGYVRAAGQTPMEFAREVQAREGGDVDWLERLTRHYYRVRFRDAPLTPHEQSEVQALLAGAEKWLRRSSE